MRSRVAAIVLLGLQSAGAAAVPQDRVPGGLRGCVAPDITLDGWQVSCDGAILLIADGPGAGSCTADECVERQVGASMAAIGADATRREATIRLSGTARRLIVLDQRAEGGNSARVLIAVLARPEGMRILSCLGAREHEARCHAAFEAMSSLPWRAGVPSTIPRAPATFVGRTYRAPSDCTAQTSDAGGGVTCGDDSSFMWQTTRDPAADEAAFIDPYSRMNLTERQVECAIDGSATTCRSFRSPDGRNIGFDVARAIVRGKTVVVMCWNWTGIATVPRACAGVLTFRPDRRHRPQRPE